MRATVHQLFAACRRAAVPHLRAEGIFRDRFQHITKGLSRSLGAKMHPEWRKIFDKFACDDLMHSIRPHILPKAFKVLTSEHQLNLESLKALPWANTNRLGVYGILLTPRSSQASDNDNQSHLYVDNASEYSKGLNYKGNQHLETGLDEMGFFTPNFSSKCCVSSADFFTLMVWNNGRDARPWTPDERDIVVLSQVVLMNWLRAFARAEFKTIQTGNRSLDPWSEESFAYAGRRCINPLTLKPPSVQGTSHLRDHVEDRDDEDKGF